MEAELGGGGTGRSRGRGTLLMTYCKKRFYFSIKEKKNLCDFVLMNKNDQDKLNMTAHDGGDV